MHPFLSLDFNFGTVFLYNGEQYHRWGIGELDLALIHTAVGIRYWSKKSVRYSKLAGSLKIYGAVCFLNTNVKIFPWFIEGF